MSRALGRYELLRPLARGGMGEVYLARRRAAGVEKWLVVKRMRPEKSGDARFLDLFVREARLSMSLAHQNIVPVFDFGRIDDQVFLAMERVEGKDLGSALAAAGRGLPPLLAAFVAAECCEALDYAHRRKGPDGAPLGIVHRDVTPRNVLLSWSGEVKLTDFGIAALAGDATSKTIGTPSYMAPEQARGEPLDVRADVYAIGMVLREAVTGKRPRPGNDREALLAAAQKGTLEPWPDDFASPLRAIADRATALAKEDRYPDARSLLEELDGFMVGERSAIKSESQARQLAAWLADVWKDQRDDAAADDAIEGEHLVSFLDDGALDVIGTGTQRSMLATAADDAAPAPAPTRTPTVESTPAPEPKRSRRWIAIAGVGAIALAGVAIGFAMRGGDSAPAVAAAQPTLPPPPPPQKFEPPPPPPPPPPPQVHEAEPPPPAPPPRPRHVVAPPIKKAALPDASPPAAPAVVKHKVLIGSTPWSNWTVDDDPTPHQDRETVLLAPGPHRIHYTGNQYNKVDRVVTITVPDADGFTHSEALGPSP